ncbi:FUSC family protein [Streptomyces sp. SP17BM10]|uniref:FUSC family protein n=1 Tax=Streptomyces sp. SP17BM10 TaxID=3002530 RepID=UPI002E7686D2|nr:FUSC family protein [Streptomyces sp. SP17BM10]MEE1788909.1 FUSC family protein [Streptomyces sp. SP17BM10]
MPVEEIPATAWWARAVRPSPVAFPGALVVRAAAGMGVPLVLGLVAHRLDLGVFAGLGAMHATMNDRAEPNGLRVRRIGTAVLASALGMLIGTVLQYAHVSPVVLGAALTVVAFVSGALSATGPRGSAAGMLLLVSTALGSGMPLARPWWAAAPMMLVGAAFVVVLGLPASPDARNRALAAAYDALGRMLADLGTPQGPASRRVLTARLNQVQDFHPDRSDPRYEAALAASEAATGLLWARRPVPPEVADVPVRLARAIERTTERTTEHPGAGTVGTAGPTTVPAWHPDTPARRALDAALRAAADTVAGREVALGTAPAPPPDPWRLRARLLSRSSATYGLRVALCIAVGAVVTANYPLSKSYWVPMTIAFVLKPDLGSVFLRATSRAVGTVLGVALTAAVLSATTDEWVLTAVAALCVALLPYATAAHYGLTTLAMTPMALLLLQLGGQSSAAEFRPRVLDTALASAIVLVFGYLLWPERPRHRIEPRLVDAATTLRAYLDAVTTTGRAEVWLRRAAYRSLADARLEVQQGLAEPPPTGRLAERWLPATAALERLGGGVAAYAAQIRYGGRVPDPAEVDRVRRALDDLTAAARAHRPPTGPAAGPTTPHDPARSALGRAADELDALLTD